ncbi:MAG: hypothetical protein ABIC68_07715 [Candidatus Omnitrophota bacterium]
MTIARLVIKEKYFVVLFLFLWIFFTIPMIDLQIIKAVSSTSKICFFSPQLKNEIIDGVFYYFMEYCQATIPENADILFKIVPENPAFRSRDYYEAEYYVGKSPYYLYPRRIFRQEDGFLKAKYTITYDCSTKFFSISNP